MNRTRPGRVAGVVLLAGTVSLLVGCGGKKPSAQAGICPEHNVAETIDPFCHPELVETMGFCHGHGVPEAYCTRCNPAVIPAFQAENDWCAEHSLPESQCAACNPELAAGSANGAGAPPDGRRPEASSHDGHDHGQEAAADVPFDPFADTPFRLVREEATLRAVRVPSVHCANEAVVVHLATPAVADEVGIVHAVAVETPLAETLLRNATLAYDADRFARLAPAAPGVVAAVNVQPGDRVRAGDVLARISSMKLGETKAELLDATAHLRLREAEFERVRELAERGLASDREVLAAETELAESRIAEAGARRRLQSLGLSEAEVTRVVRENDTSPLLPVTSPMDGVVVERDAAIGEMADGMRVLFAVADTRRMWAWLDLQESDLPIAEPGQEIVLAADGLGGELFAGTLRWISSSVDPRTRTVRARAEVENPEGLLRVNMFARANILTREHVSGVTVPAGAVQWEGCCNVVFVRRDAASYQTRKVRLGHRLGDRYEVLEGLRPGEIVATGGSYLLKTEILKGNIGAGCCEVVGQGT